MTTHEMARMLLDGPDIPVLLGTGREDGSLLNPASRDGKFPVRDCVSGNEDERWDAKGNLITTQVVILSGELA